MGDDQRRTGTGPEVRGERPGQFGVAPVVEVGRRLVQDQDLPSLLPHFPQAKDMFFAE
ncbi:hypothetical protein I3W98_37585, partial [Streptomyces cavourensis]|nr:hypothetical protein [Streptomyces cavourensis]